ncbi:hypothetical protein U5801_27010 [Lamprobacter modestohalophilus]|uniref:hypothetical protein n=1 Tax=Lamprobacter modestohalophilus TaxID=1064514 RepID=UPI002ADEEF54|nr:hypothetical protein [Lamprobacter modestohalophilus]MEA1053426.1 hypothetical protein [Lamprobacter modestohalophilus]
MRLPPPDDPRGDRIMRLPRSTVLLVLQQHGVEVECSDPTEEGLVCCTLIDEDVAETHWLPDQVGGDMVKSLARKFGIPSLAFFYDLTKDPGLPRHH